MPQNLATLTRAELPGARDDKLFFAQVREDPLLEIGAFAGRPEGPLAVVGSGGCTVLSLIAAGADEVVGVDLNRTQNHISELKAVAVRLVPSEVVPFLGGAPGDSAARLEIYRSLRGVLTEGARAYWDRRPQTVGRGVLRAGVTERLIAAVTGTIRSVANPRSRIERLALCGTVDEQRELYEREWNNRRWRSLFHLLCNRVVLHRAYDPAFFEHVDSPGFARHFLRTMEHAITELPIRDNYFFHDMFLGRYQTSSGGGLPLYLSAAGTGAMADVDRRLTLVDGTIQDHLRGCADRSVAGFSLSNICEWLTLEQIDDLFGEIVRTARPGARLCFRNFLGWTEVPDRWRDTVVEDRALGERLMVRDRSMMQRRFAVCTIGG